MKSCLGRASVSRKIKGAKEKSSADDKTRIEEGHRSLPVEISLVMKAPKKS